MTKRYSKKNFVKEMALELGVSERYASILHDRFMRCIENAILQGHSVQLQDIGVISPKSLAPREITVPTVETIVRVKERRGVRFKTSKVLKNALNNK